MLKKALIVTFIMLITGCASTKPYVVPDTIAGVNNQNDQFNRVFAITHRIFVANEPICSKKRENYGFRAQSLSGEGSKAQSNIWAKALGLQEQPTVTYVSPHSAANKAALLEGDAIIAVNNYKWAEAESKEAFRRQLNESLRAPALNLTILRDGSQKTLNLTADTACDYSFILSITDRHSAMALGRKIIVESGAVSLLKRDDELAFLISHELAHILLGHTLPERKKELSDYKMRNILEKDADALGIRIMVRAGYNPKGAETALKSTDLIDSGPVTNFFNYHGPYMDVNERIKHLRAVLNQ